MMADEDKGKKPIRVIKNYLDRFVKEQNLAIVPDSTVLILRHMK